MSNILDLDLLLPEPGEVKLGGKTLKVYVPKLKRLLKIAKLETELPKIADPDEMEKMIIDALKPIIPGIADPELDFTFEQLRGLITFAKNLAVPEEVVEAKKEYPPEKKIVSQEPLPTSSTTTPVTPST